MVGVRPERAQARGRALLNLRLRDAEGGLLGRTLLTFILNKVCCPAPTAIKVAAGLLLMTEEILETSMPFAVGSIS